MQSKEVFPRRKPNRLPHFDYTSNGAYFITVCTKDRRPIFWNAHVGEAISLPSQPAFSLSNCGKTVATAVQSISNFYPHVTVD